MKQLHFRNTFKPKHWRGLTHTHLQTVLESHVFLKEKRDSAIKGRAVVGGNTQRDFISKEDSSSPTVATKAVLLSCIINAEEERDVAIINILNAFIQTRVEDEKEMAFIKIREVLLDILVEMPQICTSRTSQPTKRVWNSWWYSARTRCMARWLQAFNTTVSLQRVWQTLGLSLTSTIYASLPRWLTDNRWLYVITWMILSWSTAGEKSMIRWSSVLDNNMKASSETYFGRWR